MPDIEEVLPKYLQIANHIRDQIVRGDLPPGAEVPSEREIAVDWKVARPTAGKALHALREQGFVESRRGSGTFVRSRRPGLRSRIDRAVEFDNAPAPGEKVTFLDAEVVDAPTTIADALELDEDSRVVQRRRLIANDTGPLELSTSWFPFVILDRAPRLLESGGIRGGTARYLEDALGHRPAVIRDQVCARLANSAERRHLDLARPAAVLVYRVTAYDRDRVPMQVDEAVYPPEHWAFRQEYPISH